MLSNNGVVDTKTLIATDTINKTELPTEPGVLIVNGGASIAKNLYIESNGILKILNTLDSTSITSGSLIVSGGIGCSNRITSNTMTVLTTCTANTDVANKLYVDTHSGGSDVPGVQVYFVGGNGSDTVNDGLTINTAFLTVNKACTIIGTSATNYYRFAVVSCDGYTKETSNFNAIKFTNIEMWNSIVRTTCTLGDGSNYSFGELLGYGTNILVDFNYSGTRTVSSCAFGNKISAGYVNCAANQGINYLDVNHIIESTNAVNAIICYAGSTLNVDCVKIKGKITADGSGAIININLDCDLTEATFSEINGGIINRRKIASTETSTSTTTGALIISGGLGLVENLNVGGIIKILNTTTSTTTTSGALIVSGGFGLTENLNVGGITKILNTTAASGTNTGSLVISGGANINKNLIIASTEAPSNTVITSGALVIAGGARVNGKIKCFTTPTEDNDVIRYQDISPIKYTLGITLNYFNTTGTQTVYFYDVVGGTEMTTIFNPAPTDSNMVFYLIKYLGIVTLHTESNLSINIPKKGNPGAAYATYVTFTTVVPSNFRPIINTSFMLPLTNTTYSSTGVIKFIIKSDGSMCGFMCDSFSAGIYSTAYGSSLTITHSASISHTYSTLSLT